MSANATTRYWGDCLACGHPWRLDADGFCAPCAERRIRPHLARLRPMPPSRQYRRQRASYRAPYAALSRFEQRISRLAATPAGELVTAVLVGASLAYVVLVGVRLVYAIATKGGLI